MAKANSKIGNLAILLIMGAVLGAFGGLVVRLFIALFERLQHLLWTDIPAQLPTSWPNSTYTVTVCVVGGVLVGLGAKYLGDYPDNLQQAIQTFTKTGKFDYKHIPQTIVNSLLSLGFGAALGPEAALTSIIGGFCTWTSEKLHLVSSKRNNFATKLHFRLAFLVGLLSGFYAYKVTGSGSSGYFNFPVLPYSFEVIDLIYALVVGLSGFLGGLLFLQLGKYTQRLFKNVSGTVGKAVLGGLILGLLGALWPLVLFSGHEGISQLMTTYALASAAALIGVALVKSLATNVLLSTRWKGGQFFPVMFAGSAIGLGVANLAGFPAMVGIVAGMTAMLATTLKKPIVAGLLVLFFFPVNLYPTILISSLLIGVLLKADLKRLANR